MTRLDRINNLNSCNENGPEKGTRLLIKCAAFRLNDWKGGVHSTFPLWLGKMKVL